MVAKLPNQVIIEMAKRGHRIPYKYKLVIKSYKICDEI